jgi:hypothetical protein
MDRGHRGAIPESPGRGGARGRVALRKAAVARYRDSARVPNPDVRGLRRALLPPPPPPQLLQLLPAAVITASLLLLLASGVGAMQAPVLATGLSFACAVDGRSQILCWGGLGAVPPSGNVTSITAGYYHACALQASGLAVCWGDVNTGKGGSAHVYTVLLVCVRACARACACALACVRA